MDVNRYRILVVLPFYGGSLPIGHYCAKALIELGHSVRVFDAEKFYSANTALRELDITDSKRVPLVASFLRFVSQAIWAMAEEQQPQIVLALAQAPLDKITLTKMRNAKMATVMWFVEDWQIFNYWLNMAPLYDAFAIIQKEPFLSELAKIGQTHAFYLPLAALPEFHKQLDLSSAEKRKYGADIGFLGAGYPNRRLAFRQLANRDFKIWGSDWVGDKYLEKNIQENGRRIGEEESVKIYNASKINLNLHSSIKPDTMVNYGDFVNPRTFELAAMAAFQLVDKRSLMPELFLDDELATFENVTELEEKIEYFLKHPEEREKIAKKSRERVLKNHTYQIRMKQLVSYMEEHFGPFEEEAQGLDEFDDNLKEEIKQEMKRLGLSPNASFDDVIARIRQQQGNLTPFETGLLFLAEIRRQYGK